jgi:hypothetical protein
VNCCQALVVRSSQLAARSLQRSALPNPFLISSVYVINAFYERIIPHHVTPPGFSFFLPVSERGQFS